MLEVKKLTVCYNDFLALNEISLKIQEGALTGIFGPNGAGKSTLLKAMLNIIPHQGEVSINNEDINKKLVKIAYVEQKADIDFTFPIKVKECVSMGTYAGMKVFQRIKNAEWQKVSKALEKVDMGKYSNHQIGELSGGQFQRVLLARCLAQNADFIFLDEPFVGIDLVSERIIMDTLKELKHQGKTVLIVHHDLSKVKKYFDNIILLNRNLIAHGSVESVFNEENLKKAYGDTIFIGEGNNMLQNFINGLYDFHFLQNALITSVVIGIVSGTVGCFIILRGMSLMGDAISHAVLPGVAISYILGINFFIGAIVFGLLASIIITFIKSNSVIKGDTAIGITFSSFLALGVILIGVANSSTDLFHILFGNILAVQDIDKWITIGVSVLVLVIVVLFFKELLITSFDPLMAKAMGMNVNFYHYLLMVLLTLVAVTAMQSVGTILIVAMLITPAATAYLYANSLKTMIFISATVGASSSLLGLFIGYSFNIAAGSSIVLTAASLFVISFLISPKQKFLRKKERSL